MFLRIFHRDEAEEALPPDGSGAVCNEGVGLQETLEGVEVFNFCVVLPIEVNGNKAGPLPDVLGLGSCKDPGGHEARESLLEFLLFVRRGLPDLLDLLLPFPGPDSLEDRPEVH